MIRRFAAVFALGATLFSLRAENLGFVSTTDKNPLQYSVNEPMTFTLTLVDRDNSNQPVAGRSLVWHRYGDDGIEDNGEATSDSPLVLTTSIAKPGFVRFVVNVLDSQGRIVGENDACNIHKFDGSAGADIFEIPEWRTPDDFADFWRTAVDRLLATPYTVSRFASGNADPDADPDVEYRIFEISTFPGERPATGIVCWPKSARPKSLGIVAHAFGYSNANITPLPSAAEAKTGKIVVSLCRHGEDPRSSDPTYYTRIWAQELNGYCFRNNGGKVEDTDYFKMLMRDLRSLQFAKTLPEWNGREIKLEGTSMGGYQAIGCAALDKDVTACEATVPWSADLSGTAKFGRMTGWHDDWTPTLDYVDLKNLAKLVTIPVSFTAGLGDYTCPPSTEVMLYRCLDVPSKQGLFVQNRGHEGVFGVNPPSYALHHSPNRTLVFSANSGNNWSTAANWLDVDTQAVATPQDGDVLRIDAANQNPVNDMDRIALHRLVFNGAGLFNQLTGNPILFGDGNEGIYNEGCMWFDAPVEVDDDSIEIYCSSMGNHRAPIRGKDGRPFKILKTGSGELGLNNCQGKTEYAGLKEIEIREGKVTFLCQKYEGDMSKIPSRVRIACVGGHVSAAASCEIKDAEVVLGQSGSRIIVDSGVTLTVGSVFTSDGKFAAAGTYTSSNVGWISGGGTVKVAPKRLVWCGSGADVYSLRWSNPNNWRVDGSDPVEHAKPKNGDTIRLPGNMTTENDMTGFAPYKVEIAGNSDVRPHGNPIVFEEGSWGIVNEGVAVWRVPTIVRAKRINVHCASGFYCQAAFYNDEGNGFEVVKTGTEFLGLQYNATWTTQDCTGFSGVRIEEGPLIFNCQGSGDMSRLPDAFTVTFAGANSRILCDGDCDVRGLTIVDEVGGGSYKIGNRYEGSTLRGGSLRVTGSPAADSQVFCGNIDFVQSAAFRWAPAESAKEFVVSGSAMTTAGTLEVANGTFRLTDGATFTRLGTLQLTGAAAAFAVDAVPSQPFVAGTLSVASGAKVRAAKGVVLRASSLSVGGVAQYAGLYTGSGPRGSKVDWMEGEGIVYVPGSGVVDPTADPGADTSGNWTAQGSIPNIYVPENWENAALPDLTGGALLASFAAGAEAKLDRNSWLRGLSLNAPGAFAFTSDGTRFCQLGRNGITTAGTGRDYAFGWPLYLSAPQTWTVGAGDRLSVGGTVDGELETLTVAGAGTLSVGSPRFAGAKRVSVDFATTGITLDGATVVGSLVSAATSASSGKFAVAAGTENVIEGDLSFAPNAGATWTFGAGSVLRVKGRLVRGAGNVLNVGDNGTLILDGPIAYEGDARGSVVTVGANKRMYFNAADNDFGTMMFKLAGDGTTIYTTVPHAFSAERTNRLIADRKTGVVWDLCGCDQGLSLLQLPGAGFTITSANAATLRLKVHDWGESFGNVSNCAATNDNVFAGGVGLSFEGTRFIRLANTSSTTGEVAVAKGRVEFAAATGSYGVGAWPNASAARVTGGTLALEHSKAFGRTMPLVVSGAGRVELAEGVQQRVGSLTVDGQVLAPGIYGGENSNAKFKPKHSDDSYVFTGSGVLVVGKVGAIIAVE